MIENSCLSLIQTIIDSQKEMVVIFHNEKHIATNIAFNKFYEVSSFEEYNENFGEIVNNFIPHPSYFHKEKIEDSESWFDAAMRLDEMDRIVSMLTQNFDPCAFSIKIDTSVENYKIVTFTDITRDLIKRIMIENNVNIDKKSGAYDKKYFLQIAQNFEDAAIFNEKILGVVLVSIDIEKNPEFCEDEKGLKEFVTYLKSSTRQDDMLIHWNGSQFLLVYLVDNEQKATQMVKKLKHILENSRWHILNSTLSAVVQKEDESISSLLKRV